MKGQFSLTSCCLFHLGLEGWHLCGVRVLEVNGLYRVVLFSSYGSACICSVLELVLGGLAWLHHQRAFVVVIC